MAKRLENNTGNIRANHFGNTKKDLKRKEKDLKNEILDESLLCALIVRDSLYEDWILGPSSNIIVVLPNRCFYILQFLPIFTFIEVR